MSEEPQFKRSRTEREGNEEGVGDAGKVSSSFVEELKALVSSGALGYHCI